MYLPTWVVVMAFAVLILGVVSAIFVVDRCGPRGLLYGQNAVLVAAMECEK